MILSLFWSGSNIFTISKFVITEEDALIILRSIGWSNSVYCQQWKSICLILNRKTLWDGIIWCLNENWCIYIGFSRRRHN
ncbi:MAG: hypothetical protein LBT66_01830 [Methanobrevibacter sp.]|nr:hypothetical protein [Candidatus Methanovirga meridionalis]